MDDMYADIILDHYRNPHNYGSIEKPDIKAKDNNPLCGDAIEISIRLDGKNIKDVKFSGQGCAISQAAASMLTDMVKGKTLDDAAKLDKKDVLEMLSVPISAVRMKCALLSLKVLKLGVYGHLGRTGDELKSL